MGKISVERVYSSAKTQKVGQFLSELKNNTESKSNFALDSAALDDFMTTAISQSESSIGCSVPEELITIRDELSAPQFSKVIKAILDGASQYEAEHDAELPADVLEVAIKKAYSTTRRAARDYSLRQSVALDSASNLSSDPIALQTNRAVVSILSSMMSASPFALYLPFDIGSNEAKLAIISHQAGLAHGKYALNENMDGANSGEPFLSSARIHKGTRGTPAGSVVDYTGKLTKVQTDRETCASGAGDLKLLKGRAIVYINGQIAGEEVTTGVLSGSIVIGALTYTISGTINTDTGVFAVTTTSSGAVLGSTVPVHVKSYIDYERDSSIIPSVITDATTYKLHAKPWQAYVQNTPGAMTQMSNELGIDPASQSMVALNTQFENERHYEALFHVKLLSAQNSDTFNFNWTNRSAQLNAASIFEDISNPVARLSQQMAINTMSYGIKYWYVGTRLAAVILGLPRTIFEPSGIAARPGIFRLGRLFGQYEVYYCPKADIVTETSTTSKILFIGQAIEAARAPIVYGDAVARITQPLGVTTDMKTGYTCYERNITEVNPHTPSSLGCASLDITDISM